MKIFLVLSAALVAAFASFPDDINWENVRQADFTPKGLGSVPSIQGRIFGGNVAQPHQFPYQVGLYIVSYTKYEQVTTWCGGSLISKEFVLTAAHCLFGEYKAGVLFGAQNIEKELKDGNMVFVFNDNFFIHPLYNPEMSTNDVALIRLPAPVELNNFVQTVQLPRRSMLQPQLEGHVVVMTGWGRIRDSGDISHELQYAYLRVLPKKTCVVSFSYLFDDNQICVSGNVKSICPGDSGGPLVTQEADGTNVVIGIASFIRTEGCERGFPTVFTRVTSYLDWISQVSGVQIRN